MQEEWKFLVLSRLAHNKDRTGRYRVSEVARDFGLKLKDVERLKLAAERGGVRVVYS